MKLLKEHKSRDIRRGFCVWHKELFFTIRLGLCKFSHCSVKFLGFQQFFTGGNMSTKNRFIGAIRHHDSTWHDGSVTIATSAGEIYALASERVGARYRHYWDSRPAYEYMRSRMNGHIPFGTENDSLRDSTHESNRFQEHHLHHAYSTFWASPFDTAAILVADGQGAHEGFTVATTTWKGTRKSIDLIETPFKTSGPFIPHSLGHFYTAISALAGMTGLYEEGKTMGLAAYGRPSKFLEYLRTYIRSEQDGTFFLDPAFIYAVFGNTFGPNYYGWSPQPPEIQKIWDEILAMRSTPMRTNGTSVSQDDMDIAYAGQTLLEEVVLGLARRLKQQTGERNLCLAGGVALNCSVNGKLLASGLFDDVYVIPAADDSGQALGRLFYDLHLDGVAIPTQIGSPYLGPLYSKKEMRLAITSTESVYVAHEGFPIVGQVAAKLIAEGKVIGWFQGRSEIGPRALGNRSILADPRNSLMRDHINQNVKHREWYRPVAPAVLEEDALLYFHVDRPLPFMLFAVQAKAEKIKDIPSAVHIDGSARVQTVNEQQNPRFYRLISEFKSLTGVPVLINTSFNDRGEPIIESPTDALLAFNRMNLDALVLGDYLILKK